MQSNLFISTISVITCWLSFLCFVRFDLVMTGNVCHDSCTALKHESCCVVQLSAAMTIIPNILVGLHCKLNALALMNVLTLDLRTFPLKQMHL